MSYARRAYQMFRNPPESKHHLQNNKQAVELLNVFFQGLYDKNFLRDYYYLFPDKTYPVTVKINDKKDTLRLKRYTCHSEKLEVFFSKIPNLTTEYYQAEGSDFFVISSTDNFKALLTQLESLLLELKNNILDQQKFMNLFINNSVKVKKGFGCSIL